MVTRSRSGAEIDDFADAVGNWLLTQEFGSIKPLAFRHRLGFVDDETYVVIELLVSDPPPRPEKWYLMDQEELMDAMTWPLDDYHALDDAAVDKAVKLGPPPRLIAHRPVGLRLFPAAEAEQYGFDPVDG